MPQDQDTDQAANQGGTFIDPQTGQAATVGTTGPQPRQPQSATDDDKPLGEAGEKALTAFKERAREAEQKLRDAESQLQQFRDKDKSAEERLASQVETLTQARDSSQAEAMRLRVAIEKKLPAELVDRLRGSTLDEMKADADELLKFVQAEATTDFEPGPRGQTQPADDMDSQIRRAAGRL